VWKDASERKEGIYICSREFDIPEKNDSPIIDPLNILFFYNNGTANLIYKPRIAVFKNVTERGSVPL